jgi:hypothetical protein
MRHKKLIEAENEVKWNIITDFGGYPQRNFEDISKLTKVRVWTFLNFFQLCYENTGTGHYIPLYSVDGPSKREASQLFQFSHHKFGSRPPLPPIRKKKYPLRKQARIEQELQSLVKKSVTEIWDKQTNRRTHTHTHK